VKVCNCEWCSGGYLLAAKDDGNTCIPHCTTDNNVQQLETFLQSILLADIKISMDAVNEVLERYVGLMQIS
jgi:hypothetical protein